MHTNPRRKNKYKSGRPRWYTAMAPYLVVWVAHWFIHRKWSGPFFRSHMNHHTRQYPPTKLLSEKYRSAGWDDGIFAFGPLATLAFIPFAGALYALGLPSELLALIIVEAAFVGFGHDRLHERFHLTETYLSRFAWFRKLRARHALQALLLEARTRS